MLKIRLTRIGRNKTPSYRIVVANSTSPRDGKHIENIGNYQPLLDLEKINANNNDLENQNSAKKEKFTFDVEKLISWLEKGAQPTDVIKRFILKMDLKDERIVKFSEKFKKEFQQRQEASKNNPKKEKVKKK